MANHAARRSQANAARLERERELAPILTPSKGQQFSTQHGWRDRPRTVTDMLNADLDYSIAGLGAYRKFRSHPGKVFPGRAAAMGVMIPGRQPKDKGKMRNRGAQLLTLNVHRPSTRL